MLWGEREGAEPASHGIECPARLAAGRAERGLLRRTAAQKERHAGRGPGPGPGPRPMGLVPAAVSRYNGANLFLSGGI